MLLFQKTFHTEDSFSVPEPHRRDLRLVNDFCL